MKKILNNLLTENEQKVLFFLVAFAFIGLLAKYTLLNAQAEDGNVSDSLNFEKDYEIKYDLRSASSEELVTIPGIGEKRAADIIDFRNKYGFATKDDLMQVKGIGQATYNKIACYFEDFGIQGITKDSTEAKNTTGTGLVNINTADVDELTKLKGIGPSKADKIIALREEFGNFSSVDQLLQIKGIGPKTLENMRDQITLGDD
jgi:competence protein ComEA